MLNEFIEALVDALLRPFKEPAAQATGRTLHILVGVVIFLFAGAFAFVAWFGLFIDARTGDFTYFGTELVMAGGCTAAAVIGIRLAFNIRGEKKQLFSPTALWILGLCWLALPALAYFLEGRVPVPALVGTLALGFGCIVLAIRRRHGA
jgi:hypothetical protein